MVKTFAKDPKSWQQMDPSWRWPILQRFRRSMGRSSCKRTKPSFWDSEQSFCQTQSVKSECCESCLFFLPKRHLKPTSTEDGLNRYEREISPTQGIHFMIVLCHKVTISFLPTQLPNHQVSRCHVFPNDAYHVVSPRLEVTADHRVVNVTHEGAQRQVAKWRPKKSCFNSMEPQNLKRLIALLKFRVQEDKVLSTPACFAGLRFESF